MKKIMFLFQFLFITIYINANEKLIPFSLNGKIGFLNENLTCVLEPQYSGSISSYVNLMVLVDCKGYDVLIGKDGELLTRGVDSIFIVDNDKYAVSQNGGSGFSRVFSSLDKSVLHFYDKVSIDNTNKTGNLIIDMYNNVSRLNVLDEKGELLFKNNTFKRIFDYDSNIQIVFVQDQDFNDCLFDINGKQVNKDSFRFGMRSFKEGFIFGKKLKTGETGFFNMDCNLVIKAGVRKGSDMDDWNSYPGISCGVTALVNDGEKNILLSEWQTIHSDNWSIVDCTGKILEYGITADKIFPFSDDVAVLMVQVGKKKVYRLIGKNGKIITDRDYDFINSSVNGYCMASKNGLDYLINSKDGTVYKCSDFK